MFNCLPLSFKVMEKIMLPKSLVYHNVMEKRKNKRQLLKRMLPKILVYHKVMEERKNKRQLLKRFLPKVSIIIKL